MGALLKAVLINGAQRLTGSEANKQGSGWPNMDQGHGIVELDATLNFHDVFKEQGLFLRGDFNDMPTFASAADPAVEHKFKSTGTSCVTPDSNGNADTKEFRATLVWHDPPASGGSSKSLVNDLDIVVEGSDGSVNHPNGGSSRDSTNNAESVVFVPTEGVTYTVKISANSIATGPQPYAYVVSGCFRSPDRPSVDGESDGSSIPIDKILMGVGGLAGLALLVGLSVFAVKAFAGRSRKPQAKYNPRAGKASAAAKRGSKRAGGGSFTSGVGLTSGAGSSGLANKSNANRPAGISMGGMNSAKRGSATGGASKTKFHGKVNKTFNNTKWGDMV
jgi:hypothetical protein